MNLSDVWFALFVLIVGGYLILDGFDMGVGILHLPMARTDMERRTLLNSIGPVWDGNEVWLVLAGGVLFAVFPLVYASLFSGFYLAFMLVLLVMILRTVAIEFRSKEESPRWRSAWDTVFGLASVGLALLFGVAFGNVAERRAAQCRGQHHDRPGGDAVAVRPARRHDDGRDVRGSRGDLPRDEDRGRPPGADRAGTAAAARDVLRPQHAGRGRDGAVPPADHRPLPGGHLAGDLPARCAPRTRRGVDLRPAGRDHSRVRLLGAR